MATYEQPVGTRTVPQHHGAVVMVATTAALGGFLFGYDTAVINGAVDAIKDTFNIGSTYVGFVVSSALLGCAVGAWFAGPLADRLGRVRVMLIAATVFAITSIGSALAWDPVSLMVWRIFGGLAIGAASVIAPAYIAEVAPADIRGRLGSLQQLAIVTGIFASLLVDQVLVLISGGATKDMPWGGPAWRWMFAAATLPAVVYGVLAAQIPESPRYLVARNNVPKAREVLRRFVGGDVDTRIREITRSLGSREQVVNLKSLRGPTFGLLTIVWTGILLSVFQQFVGINVIFYYSSALWHSVGFSEKSSFLFSTITSITNIVTTLVGIALIDRIGRKALLLIGAAGMTVTLTTMAVCFSTATGSGDNLKLSGAAGPVALIAANVYVFAFGMSWGPAVWVLLGEMFNNRIRATALAVAAAAQWLANWIISTSFPRLADFSLTFAYGMYAAFALLAFIFVRLVLRETKGRELEEM
jgi:MFS transporter, SP family, sugar:H+ symporter